MNSPSKSILATTPCTSLKGVGPSLAEKLAKRGIHTVQDLLFHLPFRYQDRTRITPLGNLRDGDYAVIEAVIINSQIKPGRKASLICQLQDATGQLDIRFFHFNASQKNNLTPGVRLRCFGEVRGHFSKLTMIHPEYRQVNDDTIVPVEETLTPIYPTTEGLQQRSLRNLTDQALASLQQGSVLQDYLPQEILQQYHLHELSAAIAYVHRPPPDAATELLEEGIHPTQQRLVFEELLTHQLSLRRLRQQIQQNRAPALQTEGKLMQQFIANLPFELTKAQYRVSDEVITDLQASQPMLRLVQGDVGSGKTVVAALAALQAVESGYQAALMAPTEILAEQHFKNFSQWLEPLGIQVAWLSGKVKGKAREAMLEAIQTGAAKVAVGTHALFQKDVEFNQLGLVIVDEQHRFGVQQRLALREKGIQGELYPHQLTMTATPIPRTLAMTAYADLDVSIIDELPPGRTPVNTAAISNTKRDEVVERIRNACMDKRQAYWVCTLIEESEVLQCQAAEDTAEQLKNALPEINVGLIHGRMKPVEKENIMAQFKAGEIDLLVATTVIEVGVDVPNASLMIIENPERLGLSQLHQLRGRVGRGTTESYCVMLYQTPLSNFSKERLKVMRETNDGFKIAQKDLEIRGPGEVLGTKQTGLARMRIADLLRDQHLIPQVRQAAKIIMQDYPECIDPLIQRWLPNAEEYMNV